MKSINPNQYNLNARVRLKKSDKNIFVVIDRKSRIIMKDGYRIVDIAKQICSFEKDIKIGVLTNAPLCSKTQKFLTENNITIKSL